MREPDLLSTSMTKLETLLKSFYLQRPDLQNKIITSAELSGYISWMASAHKAGCAERFTPENIPAFAHTSRHCSLADSFLKNPNDPQALALLSKESEVQKEDCCISADHDIRAGLTMPVAFIFLSPFTIHLTGDQRSPLQSLTNLFVGANCVRPSTIILQITMLLFVKGEDLYFLFSQLFSI